MATRRRYQTKAERLAAYKDGGAVPSGDGATPSEAAPLVAPAGPSHEHDAVKRAVEAVRRAEEYQKQVNDPQAMINAHVDSMPNLSDHKRTFLKANPLLLNENIMPHAAAAWQQGLAQGIGDDSEEMNQHILASVSQGMRQPPRIPPPGPPPQMPAYDRRPAEQAEVAGLAEMRPPPLPPAPRRSMPVSAPVSRDIPTSGGERASQAATITLSPEQREIAWSAYHWMPKPAAEAEYARQRLKLDSLRKAGMYPERGQG